MEDKANLKLWLLLHISGHQKCSFSGGEIIRDGGHTITRVGLLCLWAQRSVYDENCIECKSFGLPGLSQQRWPQSKHQKGAVSCSASIALRLKHHLLKSPSKYRYYVTGSTSVRLVTGSLMIIIIIIMFRFHWRIWQKHQFSWFFFLVHHWLCFRFILRIYPRPAASCGSWKNKLILKS